MTLVPEPSETEKKRIYSEQVSYMISSILSDRESRSTTFSLESPLSTRFWSAVKTGTSKDMRDNWCIGYSSKYTVGAWVGNFSGEPMWNVSGITGAAALWVEMISYLHRNQPSVPPLKPDGVLKSRIRFADNGTVRDEWFIEGTETVSVESGKSRTAPGRISYPASGTVVALDPDIPVDRQKMYFESSPESEYNRWLLNGKDFGTASGIKIWTPVEGIHKLSLVEKNGQPVDEVTFFVRGFRKKDEK
jgi:penicillin-binding protein 1C